MSYEFKFTGWFTDGFKWSNSELMKPEDGAYDIVGATKSSLHLVPKGKSMRERFSVPKKLVKLIRRLEHLTWEECYKESFNCLHIKCHNFKKCERRFAGEI